MNKVLTPQQAARYLIAIGYSQAKISCESGIPQPTISRILTGVHKDPRLSTASRLLALVLKVKSSQDLLVMDEISKEMPDFKC